MRIMVYGDSNSWGYLDEEDGLREPRRFEGRWPVVMARALTGQGAEASPHAGSAMVKAVELVEECLPGRTTDVDDPLRGACMNGARPLEALLLSHTPLDLILLMLGTNDLKVRYGRSPAQVVGGMMALADTITGLDYWPNVGPVARRPRLAVICPPALGARADQPDYRFHEDWIGGRDKSGFAGTGRGGLRTTRSGLLRRQSGCCLLRPRPDPLDPGGPPRLRIGHG